ncbi:MAG TPA: M28 family metallopeptidase [Candidatus Angelobacter sp.]|nr:M28 family metallopeptidase [Candidatus Angelobacter sp.]
MKRVQLFVVIVSTLVLSSFAVQNAAVQNALPLAQAGTPPAPTRKMAALGAKSGVGQESGAATQGTSSQNTSSGNIPTLGPATMFGFRDFTKQREIDQEFMKGPSTARAEQHLKILTQRPHLAGTVQDRATADYVSKNFDVAGLQTETVAYVVWMNQPSEISVTVTAPPNVKMNGPRREHVEGDPLADDPKVVMPYNGSSPSGDVEAEVVYANYGRPEDFKKLEEMKVDVRGKIVIVRYGDNFRGVKSFVAEEHGAAGVIIYSDPIDDGYFRGDAYPNGPWRPESGVQRGSIGYMFKYPGDPTTPGFASVVGLPDSKRVPPAQAASMPKIPTTPLSYADARPILENLRGPESPRDWQGALPFTYHVGSGPVKVKMHLKQDYRYWTIWNVIGKIPGTKYPDEWVVLGNHRDAWVYGAVDPNSGTAAMLETVQGFAGLLRSGWKPDRTIVFASWDAEEEGLIGSTEWGEENEAKLAHAAAYFNLDVAVSGANFGASAVPSLKGFMRDVTKIVPSPKGDSVYNVWKDEKSRQGDRRPNSNQNRAPNARVENDVPVGDLGSGSDYSVFIQHLGIPSTDMTSSGPYGVYHSAFDNFNWFKKFGDPTFVYEQQMARVFGIEALHMSAADVLPYDYELYGREIANYIDNARDKASRTLGSSAPDFTKASDAAKRFTAAGARILAIQKNPPPDAARLNQALIATERAMLSPQGLPNRPWFRHTIYAPGQYTGYAAVVIPGVNEAIDAKNTQLVTDQLQVLTDALNRAAAVLEAYQ